MLLRHNGVALGKADFLGAAEGANRCGGVGASAPTAGAQEQLKTLSRSLSGKVESMLALQAARRRFEPCAGNASNTAARSSHRSAGSSAPRRRWRSQSARGPGRGFDGLLKGLLQLHEGAACGEVGAPIGGQAELRRGGAGRLAVSK